MLGWRVTPAVLVCSAGMPVRGEGWLTSVLRWSLAGLCGRACRRDKWQTEISPLASGVFFFPSVAAGPPLADLLRERSLWDLGWLALVVHVTHRCIGQRQAVLRSSHR